MKIITEAPIEVMSNADASQKAGFFSKTAKVERKTARAADKLSRVVKRTERRAARKAKYGARPLKQAGGWFKDHLPRVRKNADGSGTKTNTDGTTTAVPAGDLAQTPNGVLIDKKDAGGKPLTTEVVGGVPTAVTKYAAAETVQAEGPDGSVAVYKVADTEQNDGEGVKKPASTSEKILIGIVIVGVLGAIIYIIKPKK